MTSIATVADHLRELLNEVAEEAARMTGCVQRLRVFSGATLVQTLVLGWLANPRATLPELTQLAAVRGVTVSPQALHQRFDARLAATVRQVLAAMLHRAVTSDPAAVPLFERFSGIYLQDGTTISLPPDLAAVWSGCGGRPGQGTAALKLQVAFDLVGGALSGPVLHAGRAQDRTSPLRTAPLPAHSLRLHDTGYVVLDDLRTYAEASVWTLCRLPVNITLAVEDGRRVSQGEVLVRRPETALDLDVRLGAAQPVSARLLAVRVPAQVAQQRRRTLRRQAKKQGQQVSRARLALADWTVLVTTAPREVLSLEEGVILARMRWQIELLFKLWKRDGLLDEWRSIQPWRILCEVYAKLIGLVLQHWLLVAGCWQTVARSLVKAAQTVRLHALALASALDRRGELLTALATLVRCLRVGCRMNTRRQQPNAFQLLLHPAWEPLT
jgi:DDE family transposase